MSLTEISWSFRVDKVECTVLRFDEYSQVERRENFDDNML